MCAGALGGMTQVSGPSPELAELADGVAMALAQTGTDVDEGIKLTQNEFARLSGGAEGTVSRRASAGEWGMTLEEARRLRSERDGRKLRGRVDDDDRPVD